MGSVVAPGATVSVCYMDRRPADGTVRGGPPTTTSGPVYGAGLDGPRSAAHSMTSPDRRRDSPPADGQASPSASRRLAESLEILVFTYDRAERLHDTLARLEDSPFGVCRITVLDNCSPDSTPDVCREFTERLPALRVVRHSRNIGLGPNYLRAVELSRADYSWILSDDETLDLHVCADVIAAVEAAEVDLISLGSPGQHAWERGLRSSTQELVDRGQRFFWVWTFAAGVIFRTETFDDHCLRSGYQHLHGDYAHFPHFEFVYESLRRDASVYVSEHVCVSRSEGSAPRTQGTPLSWFTQIVRPTTRIAEPAWRQEAVWEAAPSRRTWALALAQAIAIEKLDHPDRMWRHLAELMVSLVGPQRLLLVALAPLALVPRPALLAVRRAVAAADRVRRRYRAEA